MMSFRTGFQTLRLKKKGKSTLKCCSKLKKGQALSISLWSTTRIQFLKALYRPASSTTTCLPNSGTILLETLTTECTHPPRCLQIPTTTPKCKIKQIKTTKSQELLYSLLISRVIFPTVFRLWTSVKSQNSSQEHSSRTKSDQKNS